MGQISYRLGGRHLSPAYFAKLLDGCAKPDEERNIDFGKLPGWGASLGGNMILPTHPIPARTLPGSARGRIPPFHTLDILRAAHDRAATGADVFHLEIGQPSTPAPSLVLEAAQRALIDDPIGYSEPLGWRPLRNRIARHYGETYGVDLSPDRVVLTVGASGALLMAFTAAFDAGDRVALARPGYASYRNIMRALDIIPVELPTGPETRFQPTAAMLEALDPAPAGLLIASPANPTGTILPREEMRALAEVCNRRGIRLISDEIYHGLTYGEPASSALEAADDALIVNSFSKYFSMTGWRLGWMVVPEDLGRVIECLAGNMFLSAPTLAQRAAIAAFDARVELEANRQRYAANRALLLDALPRAGLTRLAPPDGAFYIWADIGHLTNDSLGFCQRLLAETGVAITPGLDFDTDGGGRFIRLSFAGSTSDVEEAARRLARFVGHR